MIRAYGHQATDVRDIGLGTSPDQGIADHARRHQLAIVTADKDFGELVFRQHLVHSGVALIRLAGLTPEEKAEMVVRMFEQHGQQLAQGFAVLSRRAFRFRPRLHQTGPG